MMYGGCIVAFSGNEVAKAGVTEVYDCTIPEIAKWGAFRERTGLVERTQYKITNVFL